MTDRHPRPPHPALVRIEAAHRLARVEAAVRDAIDRLSDYREHAGLVARLRDALEER